MDKSFIARKTARLLLEVEAIQFNPEKAVIFTSGWASPVYTDCRKLISFPRLRKRLMAFAEGDHPVGDRRRVAGRGGRRRDGRHSIRRLAGRPAGAAMLYVRKKPKGFGRNAQIEGDVKEGARAILVEDLASDGRSKLIFTKAMRDAGLKVSHAFVVFHYGIFPSSTEVLAADGITLHALATWWDVLAEAKASNRFPAAMLAEVESSCTPRPSGRQPMG
jgi:orotate phosphoribosyltransferase (EC 2.4.2.10)